MSNHDEVYRRDSVSFDARYFEKKKKQGNDYSVEEAFQHIYEINLWGSDESVSGEGSTAQETNKLKDCLSYIFTEFKINSITDVGCGDFGWMSNIDLENINYTGIDLLCEQINKLQENFSNSKNITFINRDFLSGNVPKSDLIICRDCLVHLSYQDIHHSIQNFKNSGSKYLLMTNFTNGKSNEDIVTGDWRTINFKLKPFLFPDPVYSFKEGCQQNDDLYDDKSLSLWRLSEV